MVTIYNSQLTKELIEAARIQTGKEYPPSQIADKVVPVMEVNPKLLKICNIVKTATNQTINSNATIYTTPTDSDFYLCGACLQATNDSISQATLQSIKITPDEMNVNTVFVGSWNITGVAKGDSQVIDLNRPIKLKRGTLITTTITGTAVGNCYATGTIWGYTIENVRA